jgi:RNA polymerase sigma-70 factor (ECF subfamily)
MLATWRAPASTVGHGIAGVDASRCPHGVEVPELPQTNEPTSATEPGVVSEDSAHCAERACVARSLSGDAVASRAIVEQHYPGMYALALRMVRDPSEAEDLVQESFARAFARLDEFDSRYRLSTWLYRIALNTCRDHIKSPRRRELPASQPLDSAGESAHWEHDPAVVHERARQVRRALSKLRPNYWEIVMLKDVMELSYDEIKDVTGCTLPGLKIRAVRARARLRKLLEDERI